MMQTQSRRAILGQIGASGVAATIAAPAMGGVDPVSMALIETHRTANAAHLAALAEQTRLELIGDPGADLVTEAPCHAAMSAFNELIATAPRTLASLRAWAAYLGEISDSGEGWIFEEEGPALVATFAEALGNLAG